MKACEILTLETFGLDDLCKFWVYYMPEINHICLHWNDDRDEETFEVDGVPYQSFLIGEL